MGILIKKKHEDILKQKLNEELRVDLGINIVVHSSTTEIDCVWCDWNSIIQASSGRPSAGRDWSTHPNSNGTDLVCPNCLGVGRTTQNTIKTIKCIEDDRKDWAIIEGKPARINTGVRKLIGKYDDIKDGDFDNNILIKAIKVVIDGSDYKVNQVRPVKLLTTFSFEAEVERLDRAGLPTSNVLSS